MSTIIKNVVVLFPKRATSDVATHGAVIKKSSSEPVEQLKSSMRQLNTLHDKLRMLLGELEELVDDRDGR